MPDLLINDVPETWAEVQRQRAARNRRSLQTELITTIETEVTFDLPQRRASIWPGCAE